MRPLLVALFVALLAACGGGAPSGAPGTGSPTTSTSSGTGAGGQAAGGGGAGQGGAGGAHAGGGGAGTGGAGTGGAGTGGIGPGGHPQGGGGAGTGGAGGAPAEHIVAGATDGVLAEPFTFGATGQGSVDIGAVSIATGAGTVHIGPHDVSAVVYERQPFGQWTLYQALAVEPDRLWVLWFYCNQGALEYVYFEGTDGTPIHYEQASGTCAEQGASSAVHAVLPAIDMPQPSLLAGYTIQGKDIELDGAKPGHVTLGAQSLVVLAFDDVDCTQKCGSPGWREVHTLLWDAAAKRVCFAIIYLFQPGQPVLIEYSLTVPDLSDPAGQTQLDATFTTP
jgi:hypothetical protein